MSRKNNNKYLWLALSIRVSITADLNGNSLLETMKTIELNLTNTLQKGLIVDSSHIDKLLNGNGSWEMRGDVSLKCEPVALINPDISQIVGIATLIAVNGSVDYLIRRNNVNQQRISDEYLQAGRFDKIDAIWTLDNAKRLAIPIPLFLQTLDETWVILDEQVQAQLALVIASINKREFGPSVLNS